MDQAQQNPISVQWNGVDSFTKGVGECDDPLTSNETLTILAAIVNECNLYDEVIIKKLD